MDTFRWGDHFWMVDFDMDCSQTEDGWFEFKGYITSGWGWEQDITQAAVCEGTAGGSSPYTSNNHMARCGYVNMFHVNSGDCTINNF